VRHRCSCRGFTTIELVVAGAIAMVVVLAMGYLILQNQRSWKWGRDKAVLQQNTTEALEWMARSVRGARTLAVVSDTRFLTYDENGSVVHTFDRVLVGGEGRLRQDAVDLVETRCTQFQVTPDDDTTSVTLLLELEDDAGNRVAAKTRATLRNRIYEF